MTHYLMRPVVTWLREWGDDAWWSATVAGARRRRAALGAGRLADARRSSSGRPAGCSTPARVRPANRSRSARAIIDQTTIERTPHEPRPNPVPRPRRRRPPSSAPRHTRRWRRDTVTRVAAAQADAVAQAARLLADSVEAGECCRPSAPVTRRRSPWRSPDGPVGSSRRTGWPCATPWPRPGWTTDPEAAGLLERDPSLAQHIYDLALDAQPQDVFLIASNSGATAASSSSRASCASAGTSWWP